MSLLFEEGYSLLIIDLLFFSSVEARVTNRSHALCKWWFIHRFSFHCPLLHLVFIDTTFFSTSVNFFAMFSYILQFFHSQVTLKLCIKTDKITLIVSLQEHLFISPSHPSQVSSFEFYSALYALISQQTYSFTCQIITFWKRHSWASGRMKRIRPITVPCTSNCIFQIMNGSPAWAKCDMKKKKKELKSIATHTH